MPNIPRPTNEILDGYLQQWRKLENYRLQEASLGLLFHQLCPENTSIEGVLLKVSALNDFYSTNIYDTYSVAKHILTQNVDARLAKSEYSLVNDIASVSMKGKSRNFYSFASKYCSHHRAEVYPIYDYFVEKMLIHYQRENEFSKFRKVELKTYPRFMEIVLSFQKFYGLEDYSLRDIDVFLWLAGKQHFPKTYR